MSKAVSLDHRLRVLAAVEAGASHREAAERFGVSGASVSHWRALPREKGEPRLSPLGGDRRSGRIEAQGGLIRALRGDARPHGPGAARGAGRARPCLRLRHAPAVLPPARDHVEKRDCARQRAGAPGRAEDAAGLVCGSARPRSGAPGLHRRDLDQDPHGPQPWPLPAWRAAADRGPARPLEDHDLHRRADAARNDRALRHRRSGQQGKLRGQCRTRAGAGAAPRRHRRHGQPRKLQEVPNPSTHRGRRCPASLPAAIQPRLQSDRAGLRKALGAAPRGRQAHRRGRLVRNGPPRRHLHPERMRKLVSRLRTRSRLMGFRSKIRR